MNDYRFPENRITKLLLTLYLFVMLYLCRDSMFCLSVVGFYPSMAVTLGLTALVALAFLWYQRKRWKAVVSDGRVKVALTVTVLILVPMVFKRDWQFMYLSILICLYTAILMTYFISWRALAKYYVLLMAALGIYSLLAAYLFRVPIDMGLLQKDVFRNASGLGFYNFLFSVVPRSYATTRNFGIFREPGVYQYFILLALFLTHYGVRWKKQRTMWVVTVILSVVMISTIATGGLAELALLALFVFFDKKLYRNKILLAVVLVILIALPGFLYYNYDYYTPLWYQIEVNIVNKFTRPGDSLFERTESLTVNLDMLRAHPFVGDKLSNVLHSMENNTSSSLILFAAFGALFGAFHVVAWGALVWDRKRNVVGNLLLMAILFLSFNTQNLIADQFFWLFPMMALTERLVIKEQT